MTNTQTQLLENLQERWQLAERRCAEIIDLDQDPPVKYINIRAKTALEELWELKQLVAQELARKDEEIEKAVNNEQGRVIKEISKYFPDHLGAMLIDVIFLGKKKSNIKGLESLINKKD